MNYQDLKVTLDELNQAVRSLEDAYIDNEGEVTEETEGMENQVAGIKELLTTEGVDMLGRWLKAKEDEKKTLKAEKDYITRKMASIDNTIDFIKGEVNKVMVAAGIDKIKGTLGYSFAPTESTTTSVDKDILNTIYGARIQEALTAARIPAYVNVSLTASATKANEYGVLDGDEEIFETHTKPTCRFGKPRTTEK